MNDPLPTEKLTSASEAALGRLSTAVIRIADTLELMLMYARPLEPSRLPSKYARVHAMGNAAYVGEVEALERGPGYRVRYLDAELQFEDIPDLPAAYGKRAHERCSKVRVKDIRAVHSVDWLDEAEYQRIAERTEQIAVSNVEHMYRDAHMPEGYELVTRAGRSSTRHGFRRLADGRVHGFDRSSREAQQSAWEDADGTLGDWPDRRADLLVPPAPTMLRWWHARTILKHWPIPAAGEHLLIDESTSDSAVRIRVLVRHTAEGIFITDQGCSAYLTREVEDVPIGPDGSRTAQVERGDTFAVGRHLLEFGEEEKIPF